MTVASAFDRAPALEDVPVLPRTIDDRAITDIVCAPLLRPAGRAGGSPSSSAHWERWR